MQPGAAPPDRCVRIERTRFRLAPEIYRQFSAADILKAVFMKLFSRPLLRFALFALALAGLSGCGYVGQGLNHVGNGVNRTARAVKNF